MDVKWKELMKLVRTVLALIITLSALTTTSLMGQSKKSRASKSRRATRAGQASKPKSPDIDFSDLPSQREAPEWKYFGTSGGQMFFYNTKNISKTQNGFTKVWVKSKYLDESAGRVETIKNRSDHNLPTTGYENFAFTLLAYEVNCGSQQFRLVSFIDYDDRGKVLESDEFEGKWSDPIPESIGKGILESACAASSGI